MDAAENKKKLEKRIKILETAFSLFKQKSVGSTASDDVVKATGIARGTFYLYFRDKTDLMEQLIMYKSGEYVKEIFRELFAEVDPEAMDLKTLAETFISGYIDFLVKNKEILAVLSKNMSACIRQETENPDPEFEKYYSVILAKMAEYGYEPEKAHIIFYILMDMIGSVCCDAILLGKPYTIDEIREPVITSALNILKNGR